MNRNCPHCTADVRHITGFGTFRRSSDRKIIKRFRCNICLKTFSDATFHRCFGQKKRSLNPLIEKYLASSVSQRRIAKLLKINVKTVARKLVYLGRIRKEDNLDFFLKCEPIKLMQFDDLETFEHTKCKPLSVTMAVEAHSREIIGFRVSQMPAKGLLAKVSRKKYGPRPDHRGRNRKELFKEISPRIHLLAEISSDNNPHYTKDVKEFFPKASFRTTRGKRGCVTGQGELKKIGFDPLFTLNHTFAMLRANINRLVRKTWCTTKKACRLEAHIHIYVHYHNQVLLKEARKKSKRKQNSQPHSA